MKHRTNSKQYLILAALFFLMTCWMFSIEQRQNDEAVADALSLNILRFHVLAASDSDEDQALKLEVRDFFLTLLRKELSEHVPTMQPSPKNAQKTVPSPAPMTESELVSTAVSGAEKQGNTRRWENEKEQKSREKQKNNEKQKNSGNSEKQGNSKKQEILAYIEQEKEHLEQAVNACIAQKGFLYTVSIQTATVHFPTRTYGDMVFPCGDYEAVQLLIGPASGHNWWCVLYPSLCFTEETGPYLPESSRRQLEQMIGKDLYETLLSQKPSAPEITFFLRRFFHPEDAA